MKKLLIILGDILFIFLLPIIVVIVGFVYLFACRMDSIDRRLNSLRDED